LLIDTVVGSETWSFKASELRPFQRPTTYLFLYGLEKSWLPRILHLIDPFSLQEILRVH
jgi:hypothetical protein